MKRLKFKNLVNMECLISKAHKNKYALLHINAANLEWVKVILTTAQETNSPIIVAVTEKTLSYMGGTKVFSQIVTNLVDEMNITVPVVLHLDHGSYEAVKKCLFAGFTSVMFDGSTLPFEENYAKTRELLKLAKKCNASFEAEVGVVGGKEDKKDMGSGELADVNQCKEISNLPITCLAAGIGNIHGIYPKNWKGLDFKLLTKISKEINNMPMVLHGGSGIPNTQIKKTISLGVAKLNVNTELLIAFSDALMDFYKANSEKLPSSKYFDIRTSFKTPMEAMKKVIIDKLKLTGSINKA